MNGPSGLRVHRNLAAALRQHAARSAATTGPLSRTSTIQRATVASVSSDSTVVTTADGIPALRLASYTAPATGDVIQIASTATGAWVALGRLAATADSGTWTALPAGTGYTALSGYQTPQYRVVGDTVQLRGSYSKGTSTVTYGDVFAVLPAQCRPPADTDVTLVCNQGSSGATNGACRGIIRAATGNIEHRGPTAGSFVSIPPMNLWTT